MILLDGNIFMIGIKGRELGANECPIHRTTTDIGGNTSVFYTFSFTLAWMVWFSFTFLRRVD